MCKRPLQLAEMVASYVPVSLVQYILLIHRWMNYTLYYDDDWQIVSTLAKLLEVF